MAFDIEMIQSVYARLEDRISQARKLVGKPLTAGIILIQRSWINKNESNFERLIFSRGMP